jgi:hypothetical protein
MTSIPPVAQSRAGVDSYLSLRALDTSLLTRLVGRLGVECLRAGWHTSEPTVIDRRGRRTSGVRSGSQTSPSTSRPEGLGPNHPAFIESLFAVGPIGCALAPVNHRASPETVSDVLVDTEPKILLLHHRFDGKAWSR